MANARHDFTTQLLMDAGICSGMRILDVGCGSGDVAFLLSDLVGSAGEIVGVDHDGAALANARSRAGQRTSPAFIQSDLLDLPASVGMFDAIVGRRVLMYQTDTVAVVKALAVHLRPGGVMVF
ncbi:class I SAM-dependent methyltransferase [Pseudomonas cannabina]|nr:class I SAM-dependent methyltransferase [Pseudomonas cannabina]